MLGSLLACAGGTIPLPAPTTVGPTWSEVAPDLIRCVACHDQGGLAFPLSTWRDAAPRAASIAAAVADRRMPPWPAGPADVAYVGDPSLTDDQIARIAAWADAGAPLGDAAPDERLVAGPVATLPRVDASLEMAEAYTPVGDEHRCFVLDRAALVEPYVTGVEVVPGAPAVVHHLMLTALVPDVPGDDPLSADLADPGPGFDCSVVTVAAFPGRSKVLGGWLPGRGPAIFPDETGIAVDPAAQIVLEAHYYAPAGSNPAGVALTPAGADRTRVDLMSAATVRAVADEIKVTHPDWGLHRGIAVAAEDTATHKLRTTLEVEANGADLGSGVLAYWVLPHMHSLGTSIRLEVVHEGETTVLVDVPRWDYDWQLTYWFAEPVAIAPEDELHLVCVHDNPTPYDVWWGESTEDEMCVARLFAAVQQ